MEGASDFDLYPDGPEEFGELGWPHPKLVEQGKGHWVPVGKDEALVWYFIIIIIIIAIIITAIILIIGRYMKHFSEDIRERGTRRGKK